MLRLGLVAILPRYRHGPRPNSHHVSCGSLRTLSPKSRTKIWNQKHSTGPESRSHPSKVYRGHINPLKHDVTGQGSQHHWPCQPSQSQSQRTRDIGEIPGTFIAIDRGRVLETAHVRRQPLILCLLTCNMQPTEPADWERRGDTRQEK